MTSVQVAGVSYKNLGEAGLEFLREWADQGARVRVPTTLNPAGLDLEQWQALGFVQTFTERQRQVIQAYTAMGITPTCTCTPYWVGNRPAFGQHIAWAESSAVSFANSVLGARTNREGGPSALAAAICGRTAAYGLHLDANRVAHPARRRPLPPGAHLRLERAGLPGRQAARDGVPCFYLHDARPDLADAGLSQCPPIAGPAQNPGRGHGRQRRGRPLSHRRPDPRSPDHPMPPRRCGADITIDDLGPGYAALNPTTPRRPGRPGQHRLPPRLRAEIAAVAHAVAGKRSGRAVGHHRARDARADGRPTIANHRGRRRPRRRRHLPGRRPGRELGFRSMATNSAKMAAYTPSHSGLRCALAPWTSASRPRSAAARVRALEERVDKKLKSCHIQAP